MYFSKSFLKDSIGMEDKQILLFLWQLIKILPSLSF